jgi:hypothetical protein
MAGAAGDGGLTVLAALVLAAATIPQTPQAFVMQLYARYRDENYSPLDRIDAVFAPRLAAAIRLDRKLAGPGYVGALDGDPICLCQDAEGLWASIRHISQPSPGRATALVTLHYAGQPPTAPARLTLVRTTQGWRVADTAMEDGRSLIAWLDRQNAANAAPRETARH